MLKKCLVAGVAGSLLLASAALAQDAMRSDRAATTQNSMQGSVSDISYQGNWRASKMVGLNVYNDQNENVGSINDLLMDKSGTIKAAVLSVGGVLGMGARYVAIPFDQMKFSSEPVSYAGASNANPSQPSSNTVGSTASQPSSSATSSSSSSKPNPWYPDHAMLSTSKDELTNMPEFKYSE